MQKYIVPALLVLLVGAIIFGAIYVPMALSSKPAVATQQVSAYVPTATTSSTVMTQKQYDYYIALCQQTSNDPVAFAQSMFSYITTIEQVQGAQKWQASDLITRLNQIKYATPVATAP